MGCWQRPTWARTSLNNCTPCLRKLENGFCFLLCATVHRPVHQATRAPLSNATRLKAFVCHLCGNREKALLNKRYRLKQNSPASLSTCHMMAMQGCFKHLNLNHSRRTAKGLKGYICCCSFFTPEHQLGTRTRAAATWLNANDRRGTSSPFTCFGRARCMYLQSFQALRNPAR